ncbi:hypothetical protein MTO96_012934 [Rhipicephalus appendiculatus]
MFAFPRYSGRTTVLHAYHDIFGVALGNPHLAGYIDNDLPDVTVLVATWEPRSRTFLSDIQARPAAHSVFRPRNQTKAYGIVSGDVVVGRRTRISDATRPARPLPRHLSTSQGHVTADCGATPRNGARAPAARRDGPPRCWGCHNPVDMGSESLPGAEVRL